MVFMERRAAVVWTCLLGAGLVLVLPPGFSEACPQSPELIKCAFMYKDNVTCYWKPAGPPPVKYTLTVERNRFKNFTCTTSHTNCTANISGSAISIKYCITITAHCESGNSSSRTRCQDGKLEVMLPPVNLKAVWAESSQCLNMTWEKKDFVSFCVSKNEIEANNLGSQIEFTEQGKLQGQVANVTVGDYLFKVCLFKPDTSYKIKLRHRYKGPASPWSPWSNAESGKTRQAAPSAAPAFWREIKQTYRNGTRLVSLLWKPLPHSVANSRAVSYKVTCYTESSQVLGDHGNCSGLHRTSTSCDLHLPAGNGSCTLTAYNLAGSSPEARIWLLGASETEPPALKQVTARPLNESRLEVNWTAPVDPSVSGFVVEWFAVKEKNSSVLHWEKLNSNSTMVVITEGLKAMERYAVTVYALYGERGAGKNRTLEIYTRQGTSSGGPNVKVQRILGSSVELTWDPVPVEKLHGFIRNYTLSYSSNNQTERRVYVLGHDNHYILGKLLPGTYKIFMQVNTDAGTGARGDSATVHIGEGSEEILPVVYIVVPLLLTSLLLVLMTCLTHSKMFKQKLCKDVPDPSNSTVSRWTPKTAVETINLLVVPETPEIKCPEVSLLGELQNSEPDQDHSYRSVCNLQTYSTYQYSPLPERNSELRYSAKAKMTSVTDLSSHPSTYSNVLLSQPLQNLPALLAWQRSTVSDVNLRLGGASEPSHLHLPPTDEHKAFRDFLKRHQSPVSFSMFSSLSHPSVFLSHPAEITSSEHPFSQSSSKMIQLDTLSHPDALSDKFTGSFPPPPPSVSVDFSYSPVQCEPYLPYE